MKNIVVPGALVSEERKKLGSNVFVSDGKIYSKVLGLYESESDYANVVAFNGMYYPKRDDVIIGIVTRIVFSGYELEINSFSKSFVQRREVRDELKMGDIVSAKVDVVDEMKEAKLMFPRLLYGGEVIKITPAKVPRFIGKSASMYELLKEGTGSNLLVGKNGRIWAKDGNISLLKKAIAFIEENFYKSHLTKAVEDLLKEENKKVK